MEGYCKKKKYALFFLILVLKISIRYTYECPKENPILKDNECWLTYCSQSQINTGICTVNNLLIKTQWLNDIIIVGENNYIYVNFATSSKGEMILETSAKKGD